MSAILKSVDELLKPVLQQLSPVTPCRLPLECASGGVIAELVRASHAMPERAIALRSGLAVASIDLVGASPQSPVVLSSKPLAVVAGAPLPEGCDAVIYPTAVTQMGAMLVVSEAATPGLNARLEGQDLVPGTVVASAGQRITPEAMLACRIAGIGSIAVRQPRVSVQLKDAMHKAWVKQRISALGFLTCEDAVQSNIVIRDASQTALRLALQPGDTAWVETTPDGTVHVDLPARFDGLVAGYAALVLPIAARLAWLCLRSRAMPLTRKISSSIGMTELALLRSTTAGFEPLAVGDVTLSAVAQADAYMLISPTSEGHAAGEIVKGIRLAEPFGFDLPEGST